MTAAAQEAEGDQELERYQVCFQKMIDANAQDNGFMRKCLGIYDKPVPKKGKKGALDFLSKEDAARTLQRLTPELRTCYDKLLVQTKELGLMPEGVVEMRFEIKADGVVSDLAFLPSSLTDVGLLACMKERVKAATFPKTDQQGLVTALASFEFFAKAGRKGDVSLAKDSPKLSGTAYDYAQRDAFGVFRKHSDGIRRCYDAQIHRDPKAQGQAALDVTVTAKGKVQRVTWREPVSFDDEFKACLTGEIKTWRYPRPKSGEGTTIHYPPFTFTPR